MSSSRVARALLRSVILVTACLAAACEEFLEGEFLSAHVEIVFQNPTPDMLPEDGATQCYVSDESLFVLFKELPGSGIAPEVVRVDVAAPTAGRVDADANTCTIGAFMRWRPDSRYHVVATNGPNWLTRCEQSLQFFVVPPARHVVRFTVGAEGCELGLEQQG